MDLVMKERLSYWFLRGESMANSSRPHPLRCDIYNEFCSLSF